MEYIREIDIEIDRSCITRIPVIQFDSARTLIFTIYEHGSKLSLANKTVRVWGEKADKTKIYKDLSIINEAGKCKLELTNNMLAVAGRLKLMLVISEKDKILSTTIIIVDIEKSLKNDEAVESTDEFTALEDALTSVQEWDEYFNQTSGQIEEKYTTRLSEAEKDIVLLKNSERKIKSSFSISEWWTYTASDSSKDAVKLICASHERITKDLELFKKIGVDGLSLCVYGTYGIDKLDTSITTNHWYMVQKIDDVIYICSECKRLGLKVTHLKFMFYGLTNYASTTAGFLIKHMDTFQPFWKETINNYCKAIKEAGYNVDVVTVLNEVPDIYNANTYKDLVLELLNIPKKYNYKASISCTNLGEIITMDTDIKNNLDIFCCNMYPKGSCNGSNSTLEEQIQCWNRMIILAKALKEDYPNKQLYMTETGCRDT